MLQLSEGKGVFYPAASEGKFLAFCRRILARRKRAEPFSRLLSTYFDEVLFPVQARSGKLQLGFSLWDHDPVQQIARLVTAAGFDHSSDRYPKVLKYGEGIVGTLLKDLNDDSSLVGYVSCDYEVDTHLAAANTIIEEFGFHSGLAFPIVLRNRLAGIFKVYCTEKLSRSVTEDSQRLKLESHRLSFVLTLAQAHFSSLMRTQLANRFRYVDTQLPVAPPSRLMELLKETVGDCLMLTTKVVNSRGATITLNDQVFQHVGSSDTSGPDSFGIGLSNVNEPRGPAIGYLQLQPKLDGTYFSSFDQRILTGIAQTFSKYLSLHLFLAEQSDRLQMQLKRQRELLHIVQKISLQLVLAKGREEIVEAMLRGIKDSFSFSDLIFLSFEGGKLKPYMSLPESIAARLVNDNVELDVLRACVVKNTGWEFGSDCPNCCECDGLTSISALQRAALRIPNIEDHKIQRLYHDFGVSAKSEFVLPLSVGKVIYGVLDMYKKTSGDIDDYEWFFLEAICNFASLAFYNRYLFDVLEDIQREENRGEMARDVVHTLTPTTSSLITHAEHLQEALNVVYNKPGEDKATIKLQLTKTMEHLHSLVDSIRQQENLIHRYETASRKTKQPEDDILLNDLIDNVITLNSYKATTKRIKFRRLLEGTPHPISAVEIDLYLILWNLINNAVKFTRGTRPTTVTIKERYSEDGVVISVRDEGVGIKEEDERHIWEPGFSTIAPGADRETSGIGLAAVHELVRAMGWDIKEKSRVNSGTEFILTIKE